jgi:ribosomal protein S18 acetylase RimI-like enzyme
MSQVEKVSFESDYELSPSEAIYYRPPTIEDLDEIYALEISSYPSDEAATLQKLQLRIEEASNVFLLAVQGDKIAGFTCGTCSIAPELTQASMSKHEEDGQLLCIHSVVVAQGLRRKGLATKMLQAYLRCVQHDFCAVGAIPRILVMST